MCTPKTVTLLLNELENSQIKKNPMGIRPILGKLIRPKIIHSIFLSPLNT